MPLTDTRIRNAKPSAKAYKLTDSHGLYLEVRPTGTKLWRYRYRIAGKENLFALGEYPKLRLADARDRRVEARKLITQGIHPAHQRRTERLTRHAENANTFEAVAREWMEKRGVTWGPSYAHKVHSFLASDVFPHIGALPIRSVTAPQLLSILRQVEARDAKSVALLLRQWCSAIFRYGVSTLRAENDPAASLKGALHRPRTKHARPLSRSEISDFAKALQNYGGEPTTVIALRLLLLTFVRPKELREAPWTEFNLDRAEWRIPAARIERDAKSVALLLRQWCSAIFRYGVSTLRADNDPAAALKGAIQRPKTKHARPLSRTEISEFAETLESYGGEPTTVIALRLLLLTFVRPKELREAPWSEFNLDRAEWRIPGPRMKTRQEHIVPLSRQAAELLRELLAYSGGHEFLFPNRRNPNACMSATTLNRALERMGFNGGESIGFTSHGFRATASTILNEEGVRSDVIERQLAHEERNKSRASYNRAEHLQERRKLMSMWADIVDDLAAHSGIRRKAVRKAGAARRVQS